MSVDRALRGDSAHNTDSLLSFCLRSKTRLHYTCYIYRRNTHKQSKLSQKINKRQKIIVPKIGTQQTLRSIDIATALESYVHQPVQLFIMIFYGANGIGGILLRDFFFLHSNFFHKLPPPHFLLGTIAKELVVFSSSWFFKMRIFSRGCITPLETNAELGCSVSLRLGCLALSSAIIRSNREDLWCINLLSGEVNSAPVDAILLSVSVSSVLVVVETSATFVSVGIILSNRAASVGEANAFSCFPKFRIVS